MRQEPAPEGTLITRVRQGDRNALGQLYDRYAVVVYTVARRITGSTDDAEDVAQTVFLGLPLAIQGFRDDGPLESWLRRMTATTALKVLRVRRREGTLTEEMLAVFGSRYDERRMLERLTFEEALDALPTSLRTVIVLKDLEGYTHEEIAGLLDITPGNSAVRLHRARALLREWLIRRG